MRRTNMLKYFTTPEGNSVAVNPARVIFVEDVRDGAVIYFNTQQHQKVTDSYLTVVARLNEQ